jgi:hypothetical protein
LGVSIGNGTIRMMRKIVLILLVYMAHPKWLASSL